MEGTGRPSGRLLVVLGLALAVALAAGAALYWLIQQDAVIYLAHANEWLADRVIHRLGYAGVFFLMFVESSLVPFPSEIIMPPAGDLARRLPDWSLGWVIFWGVAGSLLGALFNYTLAAYLGRPVLVRLIRRFGHYVRVSEHGYEQAEHLFRRHGEFSTFTGRLLPGIRQIISLPAGLARMNLFTFSLFTSLGAGIWVAVLALLGYWFGADPEGLSAVLQRYVRWVVLGAVLLIGAYVAWQLWRRGGARGGAPGAAAGREPAPQGSEDRQ